MDRHCKSSRRKDQDSNVSAALSDDIFTFVKRKYRSDHAFRTGQRIIRFLKQGDRIDGDMLASHRVSSI